MAFAPAAMIWIGGGTTVAAGVTVTAIAGASALLSYAQTTHKAKVDEANANSKAKREGVKVIEARLQGEIAGLKAREVSNRIESELIAKAYAMGGDLGGSQGKALAYSMDTGKFNRNMADLGGRRVAMGHLSTKAGYEAQAKHARKTGKNAWKTEAVKMAISMASSGIAGGSTWGQAKELAAKRGVDGATKAVGSASWGTLYGNQNPLPFFF